MSKYSLVASHGEFQSVARQLFAVCLEAQSYCFPGETEENYLKELPVYGSRFETGISVDGAIGVSDCVAWNGSMVSMIWKEALWPNSGSAPAFVSRKLRKTTEGLI